MWLLVAFIAVPLIEIALFIQVGGAIGLFPTLAIVILTAVIGTYLMRLQGGAALQRLQSSMEQMSDPSGALADGAMILFAGALLLTPGFFTDAVGFALLIPTSREVIKRFLAARFKAHMVVSGRPGQGPGNRYRRQGPNDDIIETDYEDVTPHDGPDLPRS